MTQRVSILFYLKKSKQNKKGQVPIYLRVTIDGKRSELTTGQKIPPELWSTAKSKAKGNSEDAKNINERLKLLESKILRQYNIWDSQDYTITASDLTNEVSGRSIKKYSLLQVFKIHNDEFEQKIGIEYARTTYKKYLVTYRKVQSFIKYKYNKTDLLLEELDHNFITSLDHYLKTNDKNQHNTAAKHLTLLKKIVKIALANKWMSNNPYRDYKITRKKTNRVFLNSMELRAIEEKELSIERLDKVRDVFLFACYTGLAYSDLAKLTVNDITTEINGQKKIVIYRQKTKSRSIIPLSSKALKIIKKYASCIETEIKGTLLPVNSNQRMNGYLKEIAAICGINKNISSHIGRHTFATTLMLENGVSIETVKTILGHASILTTEIYARVTDTKVLKELSDLEKKFDDQKNILEVC